MPPDHISNAIDPEVLDWLDQLDGYSLNLGAGATTRRPEQCVEVEYSIFRNTTAVADAHNLPFKDNVFDAVVSYNTFEHLAEPAIAAKELYRVLKPGGQLRVQSAFLQPLHEEPAHFYNATEYGLRRWFEDFEVTDCFVPPKMNPGRALAWFASHTLDHIEEWEGMEVRDMFSRIRLAQWSRFWEKPTTRVGFLPLVFDRLPEHVRRRFAAGFELRARKQS
jgi:SAM-dependent methyltransferase